MIGQKVPDCRILQIIGQDPVTGIRDIVYLASRTLAPLESVARHCRAAGLIAIVGW